MSTSVVTTFMSLLALFGLAEPPPSYHQGYVEAEYLLVSPQIPGRLITRDVARGGEIKKGDLLFTLDDEAEKAALAQAEAGAAHSQAALDDLLKAKRQPELNALIAQRKQAEAALKLATLTFERDEKLLKTNAISQARLDTEKAEMDRAQGKLDETIAALEAGQQSLGRDDAIKGAEAQRDQAKAALAAAQWKLDQKRVMAPADAFVFDTLYDPGEYIGAGVPVVSLLSPEKIKVRFFVKATELDAFRMGQRVNILSGSDEAVMGATVSYISPRAEYTPPQLYNRDNRDRLLFMLEATPLDRAERLHPGLPVDVALP